MIRVSSTVQTQMLLSAWRKSFCALAVRRMPINCVAQPNPLFCEHFTSAYGRVHAHGYNACREQPPWMIVGSTQWFVSSAKVAPGDPC
jgi:hypothetical protein